MKNAFFYTLTIIFLINILSCQKELSFESNSEKAKGSLQSDLTNSCLPKFIGGTFVVAKALSDSNFIQIDLDVSKAGSYSIATNTVNGYSFSGSGIFSNTGKNTIKLKGKGKPLNAGTDNFTLSFDSSTCDIQVVVLPSGAGTQASFTLRDSVGACPDYKLSGNYIKNIALNSSNKVSLKVNVTSIGTYNISTAAVDGITFSGSGSFSSIGAQFINLTGSGTPSKTGVSVIPVAAGSSSCKFFVEVVNAAAGSAAGTISCATATINGTYKQGTSLGTSNTVQIQVNVTTPGSYSFSTNTVNGISFSTSGNFSATGLQNIVLTGKGLPTNSGETELTATFGNSACSFIIDVEAGASPPPAPSIYFWKFTSGGVTYQGNVDVDKAELTVVGGPSIFRFFGSNYTKDTSIILLLADRLGGINKDETYSTSSSTSNGATLIVSGNGTPLFTAETTNTSVNIITKITSHNTTTKVIEAIFSGTAKNQNGTTVNITNGQFKVNYK